MRNATISQRDALAEYGLNLGIAFQLVDDLLDFTSDMTKLGKPVLSDLREGKVTLPLIRFLRKHPQYIPMVNAAMEENSSVSKCAEEVLALLEEYGELERARHEAYLYAERAQKALEIFPDGKYRRALNDIAQYIVERDR
jgi:octaprenyl-diphosphate synthase